MILPIKKMTKGAHSIPTKSDAPPTYQKQVKMRGNKNWQEIDQNLGFSNVHRLSCKVQSKNWLCWLSVLWHPTYQKQFPLPIEHEKEIRRQIIDIYKEHFANNNLYHFHCCKLKSFNKKRFTKGIL